MALAHLGMASRSCLPDCGPPPGGLQMLRLYPCSACVQPQLHRFTPTVVESGFENFSILFKWSECPQPSRLCPPWVGLPLRRCARLGLARLSAHLVANIAGTTACLGLFRPRHTLPLPSALPSKGLLAVCSL